MHAAGDANPAVRPGPGTAGDDQAVFERFAEEAGPRLGCALAALYGFEDGRDATAEALAYAWENWPRLEIIANLLGYLSGSGRPAAAAGASR
jgi:predicted RNA polymerase sigma factor